MSNRNTSGSNSSNTDVVCCLSPSEIEEDNKLIAGFMNLKKVVWMSSLEGQDEITIWVNRETELTEHNHKELYYHSSWDWQIPAWSKLAHEVREFIVGKDEYTIKQYFRWVTKYEEAIFCNDLKKGYNIIVEMLKWYDAPKR